VANDLAIARIFDVEGASRATFGNADLVHPDRCVLQPCAWTVLPEKASTYAFKTFLIDLNTHKQAAQSRAVRAAWAPTPRPHDIKVFINGKDLPLTPLDGGDEYLPNPGGQARRRGSMDDRCGEHGLLRRDLDRRAGGAGSCDLQDGYDLPCPDEGADPRGSRDVLGGQGPDDTGEQGGPRLQGLPRR